MSEHEHNFEIINGAGTYCYARCIVEGCRAERAKHEIEAALSEHATQAAEIERLENDRIELAATINFMADADDDWKPWGLQTKEIREAYRDEARKASFAETVGFWKQDAALEGESDE